MVIKPKVKDFICTTAHPDGCSENVKRQINYIKNQPKVKGAKKVLIIGASTGYGLASRIACTYACDAATIGIMFEKPATLRRTATAGWYNTAAFEKMAAEDGYYAKSINGDAFSKKIKEETIQLIQQDLKKVDMVIYSLAAPRRAVEDGTIYSSVLKTVGSEFTEKSLDLKNNAITQATIFPATEEEINSTIKVMGGEDWEEWIEALVAADVLEENAATIAYSYIGPELTYPVYYNGTIGLAKKHLYETCIKLNNRFPNLNAYISVNKALVTQASSAIPIVPLYMAILYKVMKQKGVQEGCIEQIYRLFSQKFNQISPIVDEENRIRLDDYEMREDVQAQVMEYWNEITTATIQELADLKGYWEDFYHMYGFDFENVDYTKDMDLVTSNEEIQQ